MDSLAHAYRAWRLIILRSRTSTMSRLWIALPVVAATAAVGACHRATPARAGRTDVVARKSVEDVFLLTGALQAVRSEELTVPRVEGFRVQVKWIVEDGAEVGAGESVADLDTSQVAQGLEEKRLRATEARIAVEGREASLVAEASQKRFDLDKADTDVEKARIDAAIPVELRSRKEWNEKRCSDDDRTRHNSDRSYLACRLFSRISASAAPRSRARRYQDRAAAVLPRTPRR